MGFDKKQLKQLEQRFLLQHPEGFNSPEIVAIGKKHKMAKMTEFAQASFSKKAMQNVDATAEAMIKTVSRSSMVSLFEKPKFRDFVNCLNGDEKAFLVNALKQQLHGNQQKGFEAMLSLLQNAKLAKWSLMTIIPAYFKPDEEVFVKPTTAKKVLHYFEVEEITYKPLPSWPFYATYRDYINDAKTKVAKSLSPSNPAFSGFLMMTI